MSTTIQPTTPTEGVNFNTTYTAYDQTAAISSTNSPDNPGPPFALGTVIKGLNDAEFMFVKAGEAITAAFTVVVTTTFTAAGIRTANALYGMLVGVAVVDIASGAYGWIQRSGQVSTGFSVLTLCAPNVQLSATTTTGVLDDAVTTGLVKIVSQVTTTTNAVASAQVEPGVLNYPTVGPAF